MSKRECSCDDFHQSGILCRHFIAALYGYGYIYSAFEYFDPVCLVEVYAATFGSKFVLPPSRQELSLSDLSPPQKKPPCVHGHQYLDVLQAKEREQQADTTKLAAASADDMVITKQDAMTFLLL